MIINETYDNIIGKLNMYGLLSKKKIIIRIH